ncbi:PaaI family thioesterase [Sinomonas sp.]|jgi:uncharacterized protein (TIGR00369 family)|uniref:PaaI family thioesterase n=1 Tax=Sinomonas sp. TaxID=1914986 RepID=UPI003F7D3074
MTSGQRMVEWADQRPGWAALPKMGGLDFLRAMVRGEIPAPPIASLYRMRLVRADPGEVTFEWEPDQAQCSPNGSVLGGALSGPLDSALGCAVHTTLSPGQGYTSIEIKMSYLRPMQAGMGVLTCEARVTKPGSRVAFSEATVADPAGKLIATASSSFLVFPLP